MVKPAPAHGSITRAVDYLLGPVDAERRPRRSVELLHGDPNLMIKLVGALPHKGGYDSLVVAYSIGEEPSGRELRDFLKLALMVQFPGLEDRIASMAVLHRDDRSMHLHIVSARVDLHSGKQCSVKGLSTRPLQQLCRIINLRKGWSDPSDPCRARLAHWTSDIHILDDVLDRKLPIGTEVHSYARGLVIAGVLQGRLRNQQDTAVELSVLGKVERLDRHSITVSVPGIRPRDKAGIKVKFSGLLYACNLDRSRVLRLLGPYSVPQYQLRRDTTAEEDRREADDLSEKLKRDTARRTQEMIRRYAPSPTRARHSLTTRVALQNLEMPPLRPIDVRHHKPVMNDAEALDSTSTGKHDDLERHTSADRTHRRSRRPISAGERALVGEEILRAKFEWLGAGFAGLVEGIARRALGEVLRAVRAAAVRRYFANGAEAEPRTAFDSAVEGHSNQHGEDYSKSEIGAPVIASNGKELNTERSTAPDAAQKPSAQ